jgi:predicted AAA+ superfamily ATPase
MLNRVYEAALTDHLDHNRQMAFLSGPRQVGKTTSALACAKGGRYFNWDRQADRRIITSGADAVATDLQLETLSASKPTAIFDEVHRYARWKSFLKGFFDAHGEVCNVVVTGSSRLDVFKRGGDSLMGRYFLYRMHPLSVAELLDPTVPEVEIRPPRELPRAELDQLLLLGGFPEPLVKGTQRFYNRWRRLRTEQLLREDLRDLTRVQELGQIQVLAELLQHQTGQLVNFTSLASAVNVSVDTIRRWVTTLESLHYCFVVRPWFSNVPKSLRRQPKIYLRDWSLAPAGGARLENMVAAHLLKAVHLWTDLGLGVEYGLHYLRDKAKREVDFIVTRGREPWFLVEVKSSTSGGLSPALLHFQQQLKVEHAFQVVARLDYVERDCFTAKRAVRVPLTTFLSQLV